MRPFYPLLSSSDIENTDENLFRGYKSYLKS